MTTILEPSTALTTIPAAVLEACRANAAAHDRENRFFDEELQQLRAAGYLLAAVPEELGGWGLDLATLAAQQRELAKHSPAVALSLSMHHYWVGMAADLGRAGVGGVRWVLDLAAAGSVLASGHAERGNDVPVALSTTTATRTDGGWRLLGRKLFGSLGPVWDHLGVHAMGVGADGAPVVVHGFVERTAPGVAVIDTWDTLGMRATQSHDTVLDDVFLPDERVVAVDAAGEVGPVIGAMQVWAVVLIANAYLGIAERAFELAVEGAQRRTSIAIERSTLAHNPFVQHQVAEAYLELEAARAVVDRVAADWAAGVDHGDAWGPKVLAAKWHAGRAARLVVERAMEASGGGSFFRGHELERLHRDAQASMFHAGNDAFTHEAIGKAALGIDPGGARW
jgi:alkylation response protein AidB-like acyl-CoA dehydrogenase